jgi:thiol-disulfide isomerase/thioredoxin
VTAPRKSDRVSGLMLAVLVFAAFALVARQIIGVAGGPLPPRAGASAPAFSTNTPDGAAIALEAHRGRVVLLDFWATWCPPCVASMPALQRLHTEYGGKGFVVVGVNQEAGEEQLVRKFLRTHSISFPIAMDNGAIARKYGVFTFPTSFLLDRDGTIVATYRGVASESALRRDIEAALLAGEAKR